MSTLVSLERDHDSVRHFLINNIISRECSFSKEDLIKVLRSQNIYKMDYVIDDCLESLLDSGLVDKIGPRFMVRGR